MKHQVDFDLSNFGENADDYSNLEQAIQKITHESSQSLESMKKEKWFKRIFDMATLSNKKSIRVSEQISSMAQAQDILIEILKKLSNSNAKIDEMVLKNAENIEKLYGYTEILSIKVKQLLNKVVSGIDNDLNINDLKEEEEMILSALLKEAASTYDQTSKEQKEFADKTLRYIGASNSSVDIKQSIDNIDLVSTKKVLLQILLEYGFLYENNFNFNDNFEEIVDYFDFGNKTIKTIKEKIIEIYKLRGPEGFTWFTSFEDEYEDFLIIDLEIEQEEIKEINSENSEIQVSYGCNLKNISGVLEIDDGFDFIETNFIENKSIVIKDNIELTTILELKNCYIIFDETFMGINVENANLTFNKCTFINEYESETPIFQTKNTDVELNECLFNIKIPLLEGSKSSLTSNSSKFIDTSLNENDFIKTDNIEIKDNYFINVSSNKNFNHLMNGEIIESRNNQFENSNRLYKGSRSIIDNGSIFNSCKEIYSIYDGQIIVKNNKMYDCESIGELGHGHIRIFDSTFENCKEIFWFVENLEIINSTFKNCKKLVSSCSNSSIAKSHFQNCIYIFQHSKNVDVLNCKFDNSYQIIEISHGMTIQNCNFENISSSFEVEDNEENINFEGYSLFVFSIFKNSKSSIIKNCYFENINIEEEYLVQVRTVEKPNKNTLIKVIDNEFINVVSNDKKFKLNSSYFNLFNKQIPTNIGIERGNVFKIE